MTDPSNPQFPPGGFPPPYPGQPQPPPAGPAPGYPQAPPPAPGYPQAPPASAPPPAAPMPGAPPAAPPSAPPPGYPQAPMAPPPGFAPQGGFGGAPQPKPDFNALGIGSVDMTAGGNKYPFFLPGNYLVRIDRVKAFMNRNAVPYFIVEAQVHESDNHERPPGTMCSWVVKLSNDMGRVDMKKFIACANGWDPSKKENSAEVTAAVCDYAVSDTQPLKDIYLRLQCHMVRTRPTAEKPDGSPFTIHSWDNPNGYQR